MDFKSALNTISKDFNKEIIFERRVISILDDYGAFKDIPYYKLFYKTALSVGDLKKLTDSNNKNNREKEIFTFLSITGLDEQKVRQFLSIVFQCYHGSCIDTVDSPNFHDKSSDNASTNTPDNNLSPNVTANFLGIPFGILSSEFDKEIKNKKGKHCSSCIRRNLNDDVISLLYKKGYNHLSFSMYDRKCAFQSYTDNGITYNFNFAGFEGSEILVLCSPYTKVVYKVIIYLNPSKPISDEDMFLKIKAMLFDKFGKPTKDDLVKPNKTYELNDQTCLYSIDADFQIQYSNGLEGQLSIGPRSHILTYYSKQLAASLKHEIIQKADEIIKKDEVRRLGHSSSDLNDL